MTTRQRRGRPRRADAKRRRTTLAGRRGEPDRGTEELRRKKLRATRHDNLEISGAGVLLGHDLIDIEQFNMLTQITLWLERLARGWGGTGGVGGLWVSILGAATATGYVRPQNATAAGLADGARRQLARAVRQLDGSRELVVSLAEGHAPPIVLRAVEDRLTHTDKIALERLRQGLDALAGRRQRV